MKGVWPTAHRKRLKRTVSCRCSACLGLSQYGSEEIKQRRHLQRPRASPKRRCPGGKGSVIWLGQAPRKNMCKTHQTVEGTSWVGWLAGWVAGWLAASLVGWFVGSLVRWQDTLSPTNMEPDGAHLDFAMGAKLPPAECLGPAPVSLWGVRRYASGWSTLPGRAAGKTKSNGNHTGLPRWSTAHQW